MVNLKTLVCALKKSAVSTKSKMIYLSVSFSMIIASLKYIFFNLAMITKVHSRKQVLGLDMATTTGSGYLNLQ